jgi:hypothetical protein
MPERPARISADWHMRYHLRLGVVWRTRMAVPHDLNTDLAIFERHFKNLAGEIAIHIEFAKRLGEEFSLKREVHAHRPLGQMSPTGVSRAK